MNNNNIVIYQSEDGKVHLDVVYNEETMWLTQQQMSDLEKSNQAMDWFWQINEAYVRGRYSSCRELINRLNTSGLTEFLPKDSITANGRFSPYDRYQEIRDALY